MRRGSNPKEEALLCAEASNPKEEEPFYAQRSLTLRKRSLSMRRGFSIPKEEASLCAEASLSHKVD